MKFKTHPAEIYLWRNKKFSHKEAVGFDFRVKRCGNGVRLVFIGRDEEPDFMAQFILTKEQAAELAGDLQRGRCLTGIEKLCESLREAWRVDETESANAIDLSLQMPPENSN